jgi:HSP20 family protein
MSETKEKETPKTELKRRNEGVMTTTPFSFMRRFTDDMERMFEDFQGFRFPTFFDRDFWPFRKEFETFEWMPQIEVLQKNGQFMVKADLPGLTKDDVKVELTEEMLTISGERKEEKEEKGEGFYRSDRNYGRFYRQVPLPEGVKAENAEATFRNGVLEITIPAPKAETPARKLEIKEAGADKTGAKAAAG